MRLDWIYPAAGPCLTWKYVSFQFKTIIVASAEECFDLSLSVDAHTASMGDLGERAIAGVTSGVMKLGDSVTWQALHFGIGFGMTSAIVDYYRPRRFVDKQQHGPFGHWWHEHTFTALNSDHTVMVDAVTFNSPWACSELLLTGWS